MEFVVIFILSALATYRLAMMFSREIGPCRIFERIRAIPSPDSCWAKGISCLMCESVWWAFFLTVWAFLFTPLPWHFAPIYWLALSAAAVLINEKGPQL